MSKNDSRRKLLKSIAAGSGAIVAGKSLPENWAKPVVDSVILPAHAMTSILPEHAMTSGLNFGGAGLVTAHNDTNHARGGGSVAVCATQSGDMLDVTIQTGQNNARRQGILSTGGGVGTLYTINKTPDCGGLKPDDLLGAVRNYSGSGFKLLISTIGNEVFPDKYSFSVDVPLGPCPGFQKLDGPCEEI